LRAANDATIAHALGHADTRMSRRHYAHLLDRVAAAELQAKLPTFKARRSFATRCFEKRLRFNDFSP
jgi:integrase